MAEIVAYLEKELQQESQTQLVNVLPVQADQQKPTDNNILSSMQDSVLNDQALNEKAPTSNVKLAALSSVNKFAQQVNGSKLLLVDDGSESCVMLSEKLAEQGWQVNILQTKSVVTTTRADFSKTCQVFKLDTFEEGYIAKVCQAVQPLDAVIYLQAVLENQAIDYNESAKQGLKLAFSLAKHCQIKQSGQTRPAFMAITTQGGSLGFSDADITDSGMDLVQSGLAGLVKSLAHEWPNVFCRLVDFSSKIAASKKAQLISDELLDINTRLVEVAYGSEHQSLSGRLTLVAETESELANSAVKPISADNVFLVSGGAKGVTAHCVIELAKASSATFILLGRSAFNADEPDWAQGIVNEQALKQAAMQRLIDTGERATPVKVKQLLQPILAHREITDTLAAISAAGGQAHYINVDITQQETLAQALVPVLNECGAITGIIHGAGVLADKLIEQKQLTEFERVYATKIDGLAALLSVCQPELLNYFVLFSSAAGFYGNAGQSDYAIANEILNKTAYRFVAQHPQAQVVSFNWGPWDGGMVTPALKRMFEQRGVYIIPQQVGAEYFVQQLSRLTNTGPQVLIGNDLSVSHSLAEETLAESPQVKKSQQTCLSKRVYKRFITSNNPLLMDHMIANQQVLPTVCAIAWMASAIHAVYPDYYYVGFDDYQLLKGVVFDGSEAQEYQLELNMVTLADGSLTCATKVFSLNSKGRQVNHYAAQLLFEQQPLSSTLVSESLPKISAAVLAGKTSQSAQHLYQNGTLFHGQSFQGIKSILACNEQSLLLACQVPQLALAQQGDFSVTEHNVFANDLVYQALLVWVKKQLALGSLPNMTKAWRVFRQVQVGEVFYLALQIKAPKTVNAKVNKVLADIRLISTEQELLAEVTSVAVTVSKGLNDLFKANTVEQKSAELTEENG